MAKSLNEFDRLLKDGESETSFFSPEKNVDKTEQTLLDLSLSAKKNEEERIVSDDFNSMYSICLK